MPNASRETAAGRVLLFTAVSAALSAGPALAANFDISTPSTAAQTLGTGSGQTGTVEKTGSVTVSGGTVAVTVSGNNATLTNLGTISQTGTGRAVRDNSGVTGLTVNNGSTTNSTALMQAADADVIQMNKPAGVTLNNYGTMTSLNASRGGAQAVDFTAITSGTNIINNFASGVIRARDADAVRPGTNGVVNNYGTIISTVTTDTGSDGIDVQNGTGVTVNNFSGGSINGARHGITGGPDDGTTSFTTTINNNAGGTITGSSGSGINLDGFNARQTATIVNGGTIIGNGLTGDGDGIDVDGVMSLTNTGTIRSLNSFSSGSAAQSEGVTVGGGTIINSGTIEGDVAAGNTNAVGRGITIAGIDTSGTAEPIYANTIITNQSGGLIKGQSDSAIAVGGGASGFTVTVNNNAGATLMGGGTFAAVRTGADNDTIINAGTINGAGSGKAIDMGAGNNTLHINGASASILGDINGGVGGTNAMTIGPGAGNHFGYAGSISNFNTVEVQSGTTTLSGASTYTGTTVVSGGRLVLDGANRLSSGSGLQLNGGTLEIANAGGASGQTFASFSLTDDSTLALDQSSVTFNTLADIATGKSLSVLDWSSEISPTYAFRFLGDDTTNAAFLALIDGTTINGFEAIFHFDGTYTDVSAVPLPETWTMLISGLGLMGFLAYRRRIGA
jgi:autotransporter-associated beta strand protein